MSFLGIYKATYSYEPQTDQELAVKEGDILYLLEKSDVDDWWTVKKRVVGADVDEPVGLVPSNYIEPADIIGSASALYDYDKQTEEELTFKEGEPFQVFDDKDPDWILVTKDNKEFGFVPSNYIELRKGDTFPPISRAGIVPPPSSHLPISTTKIDTFPALSQRNNRAETPKDNQHEPEEEKTPPALPSKNNYQVDLPSQLQNSHDFHDHYDSEEKAPPPKPARPSTVKTPSRSSSTRERRYQPETEDEELYTWSVSEIDGRKKKKAMLAIGNGTIYFSPDSANGDSPQQWKAKDLLLYSNEKKHVFLEFRNPLYSLELHAGSKEVAARIISILGELRGSISSRGLNEIKAASTPKGSKKTGKILFPFEAQGADELTVAEGDFVNIINDKKSTDWWLVLNVSTGESGVVPAQFVEVTKEGSGSFASKFKLSRSKSKEEIKQKSPKKQAELSPKRQQQLGPKPSRVRTWEDRSGTFKVNAEFLGVVEGKIHLHKTNGVKIAVAAPKLSLVDLEYVERVTGMSLEAYKSKVKEDDKDRRERKERERRRREREDIDRERDRAERERDRREREQDREYQREETERLRRELDETKRLAAEAKETATEQARRSCSPQQQQSVYASKSQSSIRSAPKSNKEEYDWFEFFLEAGVDVNQCQRYTANFQKEQIGPSIIESIDAGILRTLGLREGDIIRVTRYLDQKFHRRSTQPAGSQGSLFSEPSGALKVNRTGSANQINSSLPSPAKAQQPPKQDDDAWTVKPAAETSTTTSKPADLQTRQFTGSMQDLVNLEPLKPTITSSSTKSVTYAPTPSKPLEPTKSKQSVAPQKADEITTQPTGIPLDPFKTGGGNLLPLATGGYIYLPIQQTGVIGLQPTNLISLQKTGGAQTPVFTGGLIPLQKTGGLQPPALTGGLIPLQKTGGLQPPALTGGLIPLQKTGRPQPPALTGSIDHTFSSSFLPLQKTGDVQATALTGGLVSANSSNFGSGFLPLQKTGPLTPGLTGNMPQFGVTPGLNGSLPPTTSFGSQPITTFGSQLPPTFTSQLPLGSTFTSQPSQFQNFGVQSTDGFVQQNFSNPALQQQSIPQASFGFQQHQTNFQTPASFLTQQTGIQPQQTNPSGTGFNTLPQQVGQLTNQFQNTNLNSLNSFSAGFQQSQQFPATSFGFQQSLSQQPQPQSQPNFGGFGQQQQQQPLEAQPTGFGFGNSNGQIQVQRANLANATADNPFGF